MFLITRLSQFTAKNGKEWVSGNFLNLKDGSTGEIFLPKEDYEAMKFDAEKKVLSAEDLASIAEAYETSNVSFDQRGRIQQLS